MNERTLTQYMKHRTKSLLTAALLLVMSSMCVSGCTPKDQELSQAESKETVLESSAQTKQNIYRLGELIVDQNGSEITEYNLAESGDVVDGNGNIVLAAGDVSSYQYSCKVFVKERQVLRQKVEAAVGQNQLLTVKPKTFSFEICVVTSDGIKNDVTVESPDPGALYFPWDQNKSHVSETDEVPLDNALPELHVQPNSDNNAVITATIVVDGKYPVVVRDAYGEVCSRLYFEADPEYYQEAKNSSEDEIVAIDNTHVHHFTRVTVEASENQQGYTEHYCAECGFTYRDNYVLALECQHKYKEKVVPPTYTTAGYEVYSCELCGDSYIDGEIPPLVCQHEETKDTIVAPTCIEPGYTLHECNICQNYDYKDQYTSPTGHSWDNGRVTLRPTCADSGEKTYTCKVCKATRTEEIEATGKHRYIPVITRQTCTEKGFTTYTCSVCGDSYVDNYTDPFGHKKTLTWSVTKRATCGESGLKEGVCPWCGETLQTEEIPATGRHNYHISVVAPTETSEGYTEHICVICGDTYKDNIKPKNGK